MDTNKISMRDEVKEILRTSYTGMDLNEDLATERILSLFGVIITSCPECGCNDLDKFEHVISCNYIMCNWYKRQD